MKEQEYLYLKVAGIREHSFMVSSIFRASCGDVTDGIAFGMGTLSFGEAIKLRDWLIEKIQQHED